MVIDEKWEYSQETTVLESLFNKIANLKTCNLSKMRLHRRCFPINVVQFSEKKFYRTPPVAASVKISTFRSRSL